MSRPGKDDQPDYHNSAAVMELATIAAASLRRRSRLRPALAIVLGSGYDLLARRCTKVLEVPYAEIPGFPAARVTGHEGRLVLGLLADVPVFASIASFAVTVSPNVPTAGLSSSVSRRFQRMLTRPTPSRCAWREARRGGRAVLH